MVKLRWLFPEQFQLEIDTVADVLEMGAMQHYAARGLERRLAVFILGGGVPKNYTLQGEPLLGQILDVHTDGFDIDVQFCVDPVDNGALSSCPAGEGHTWGKVSVDAVETGSMYCHTDVTAVFPWLVHALMQTKSARRKPFRLMDKLDEAIAFLDADVKKREKGLMETIDWDVSEVK
jgi:deoxyhypusine synthase